MVVQHHQDTMTSFNESNKIKSNNKNNNNNLNSLNNIENDLSKYSLNDSDLNDFLNGNNNDIKNNNKSTTTTNSSHSQSNSMDSLTSSINSESSSSKSNERITKEINNGLIHGHIHNFQNFTYIHGHIHTNDSLNLENHHQQQQQSLSSSSSSNSINTQLPLNNDNMSMKRRRRSSHRHFNEPESLQFSDCQHFEFLNCHDKNSILNSDIQCNEDHEDCIPKIVEICCDGKHDAENDLVPNFPSCTDHEQTNHEKMIQEQQEVQKQQEVVEAQEQAKAHAYAHSNGQAHSNAQTQAQAQLQQIQLQQQETNLMNTPGINKLDLNCDIDDCIDIKCDLDTCNIDELYCKYCEDIDQITNESTSAASASAASASASSTSSSTASNIINTIKLENTINHHDNVQQHQNNYLNVLNDNIISDHYNQQNTSTSTNNKSNNHNTTTKNDAPVSFTNPMNCINPECNAFKRHREDDEHQHVLHHHLHHNSFQHSDNHHHHHIQIHDHQSKKIKKSAFKNNNDELINFEWNFKNTGAKCEWENCSTTLDNSFQLQNHIVEDHLLSEYSLPPQSNQFSNTTTPSNNNNNSNNNNINIGSFECEWKNCDYSGYDLFSLVNHINDTHGFQYDFDINNIFKKNDQQLHQNQPNQINFPTPSSDSNDNSNISSTTINPDVKKKSRRSIQQLEECEETTCKWCQLDSTTGLISNQCNKKFSNAEELTEHLIHDHVGSGKSEYTCLWENCSRNHRNFNQRQKIIRHLHVHTRYKPFICKICNHSFAVESMLEQHMRTHSGEKPYKCKVCDKHFATSSSLSIHVRTHTGEKPLICKYPGCGKRFSESSNLTKHIKTHEKFFKCDCCAKSFSKEKQLQSHIAKYHPS